MNDELFNRGLEIRKSVLGAEFVEKSIASADDFNMPMQRLTTEYCWGAVWGREDGLPKKTRSMLNLAMLSALNRPHELKMHIGGALRNGVTRRPRSAKSCSRSLSTAVSPPASTPSGWPGRRLPNWSGPRRNNASG